MEVKEKVIVRKTPRFNLIPKCEPKPILKGSTFINKQQAEKILGRKLI